MRSIFGMPFDDMAGDAKRRVPVPIERRSNMSNKIMQRGLAIVLSAAMLFTGMHNPVTTVKAAETETAVLTDTMDSKDGWTEDWSVEKKTSDIKNIGGSANATNGWNIYSASAQTVTLSRTVNNLQAGDYKASVEIVGGSITSGKISLYEGTTEKGSKSMTSFGSWDGSDVWATTVTDKTAVAGTSVTIKIEMVLADGGWFWMDNVTLKKVTQEAEVSDDTKKEIKRTELKALIDACKALDLSKYKRAGRALLQMQIASAEGVYADTAKTLQELEAAVTDLQKAKDALVDVNVADADVNVEKVEGLDNDFIRGVDISTYKSLMDSGATFQDWDGNTLATGKPFFDLLKDAGVNYVRIRIWNDPYADADKKQGYGAGNCDVTKAAEMGKWATDAGMKVLLDFHYSDFWADPGRQLVPKAWAGLTIDQKAEALENYTKESLNTILDAGVDVGMIQVGNETSGKFCGETNWTNMSKLFAAGSRAIRSVSAEKKKDILIAIHFSNPEKSDVMKGYAESLSKNNIDYDVFASSYYPFWHKTRENLTSVLSYISKTYNKKVIVAETSWAYTMNDGDGQNNVVRVGAQWQDLTAYDISAQGQANEVRDVIEAVKNVGDAGLGIFYWEPAWIPVNVYDATAANAADILAANKQAWETYGSGWASHCSIDYDPENISEKTYGGSEWDNQALFDFSGNPLPSLNVFKYVYTGAAKAPALESYKITYELNGGTNDASNPATYTLADEVVFKAPARTGYTFEGWYSDSACTQAFSEIPEMTTGDLTLYAKWQINAPSTYKITYQLNGGKNHKNNPTTYSSQNVTLKNPTKKNYTFGGWYTDSKFKSKITAVNAATKKDITLYAKWTKVSVKKASVKKVVNNSKKKATVTINKMSGAKGYRVQYSTDNKFKKGVKTKSVTKTSVTLSGLKKGNTYYVRVCAYKLDSQNNKIYGQYGASKKVKIKK